MRGNPSTRNPIPRAAFAYGMRNFVTAVQFEWDGHEVVVHRPTDARFAIFPNGSIMLMGKSTPANWDIVELVGGVERFVAQNRASRPEA